MESQIKEFLDKVDKNNLKKSALFGIRQYGGDSEESFIFANKNGLLLFSYELLHAYLKVDSTLQEGKKEIIDFPGNDKWIDKLSNTVIDYIEPTKTINGETEASSKTTSVKSNIRIAARTILWFFIIGLSSLGLISIISWFIK